MTGLVEQLQADAMDPNVSLVTLLRKVKVAAVKLGLTDAVGWVDAELEGYSKAPPDYRILKGSLKWWNPYHGWMPVAFGDSATADHYQTWPTHEGIGSLESTLSAGSTTYQLPMPAEIGRILSANLGFTVARVICEVGRGSLVNILDRVRGLVLDWSLELERAGVTGAGLSFNPREQEAVKSAHISIGTFHGSFNTGDLTGANARVEQNHVEGSGNVSVAGSIFGDIENAVRTSAGDADAVDQIIKDLRDIRDAPDKPGKLAAYSRFVAAASNHITIIAPFLPALASWVGG